MYLYFIFLSLVYEKTLIPKTICLYLYLYKVMLVFGLIRTI